MLPRTLGGWAFLIIVVGLIFRTVGPAQAGTAVAHGLHNVATFATSVFSGI